MVKQNINNDQDKELERKMVKVTLEKKVTNGKAEYQ